MGIIGTKINIIRTASKLGVHTVQRSFVVDSHSVNTIVETAKQSKASYLFGLTE